MNKALRYVCLILSFVLIFASCETAEEEEETEKVDYDYYTNFCLNYVRSFDEAGENMTYIVLGTVTEIGESYLKNNSHDYAHSMRTPYYIGIDKVYYDETGELGDELTVVTGTGEYNGVSVGDNMPRLEEGKQYVLFIHAFDDGTGALSIQCCVEVDGKKVDPLMSPPIYDGIEKLRDLEKELYALAERKYAETDE